jgi:hypothetical protein
MIRNKPALEFVVAAVILAASVNAHAQGSTSGSGNISYGGYNWQVDQATSTSTFTATVSIGTIPNPNPAQQIPVNIHNSTTVHEVHGNISLAVWQSGTCGNGSVIVQLRDNNLNVIAGAKLQQFGVGSANLPISGTFPTPLTVKSLQLQVFADECGAQTISAGLVMN